MSLIALQTDRLRNLVELFAADIVQFLPFRPELLVDLDGRLSHLLMSLLAAADQGEVRSGSNALVAVGIHAHAKHDGLRLLLFRNLRHKRRLPGKSPISSSKAELVFVIPHSHRRHGPAATAPSGLSRCVSARDRANTAPPSSPTAAASDTRRPNRQSNFAACPC